MNDFNYKAFVASRLKDSREILNSLTPAKANLIHLQMGISGEAGELTDAIKKHTMYNQPLNMDNVIEELGDLEFYLQALRWELGLNREDILRKNMDKLSTRYPIGYSDKAAKERKDKTI